MSLTLSGPPTPTTVPSGRPAPPCEATSSPTTASPAPARTVGHRDKAIDLIRFGCLVVVVILHSMMSAAVLGPDGAVTPTVALSTTPGFTIASWFFQIMPLFFFIGGYASLSGWRRMQATGGTWSDYLRSRLRRLAIPVTVLIGFAGLGLALASELGVPAELLAEASTRIGQPLWFLAVYIGLTSLVPVAAHFHERAPRLTIVVLAAAVFAVDGLVGLTGVTALGYLNFLFVWPLVQQCGFFFADALRSPVRAELNWAVMIVALVVLGALVGLGVYSPNMLVNLNPPTGALVLLGVAQMCVLRLGHAWLSAVVAGGSEPSAVGYEQRGRMWDRIIAWGNDFGMHVYLWHMPIVITLIGGLGFLADAVSGVSLGGDHSLAGFVLPEIESGWWWASRPLWLLTVMVLASGLAVAMSKVRFFSEARLERAGRAIAATVRELTGSAASAGPAVSEGPAASEVSAASEGPAASTGTGHRGGFQWSRRTRGILAVGLAVTGIGIALLVGIAPLIWTLVSVAALMASLMLAACLRERLPAARDRAPAGRGRLPAGNLIPRTSPAAR